MASLSYHFHVYIYGVTSDLGGHALLFTRTLARVILLSCTGVYVTKNQDVSFQFALLLGRDPCRFGSACPWRLTPMWRRLPTAITQPLGLSQTPPAGLARVYFSHLTEQAESWGGRFKNARLHPPGAHTNYRLRGGYAQQLVLFLPCINTTCYTIRS